MALRSRRDIEKYKEPRYGVAREVASAVFDLLESLQPDTLSLFLSVLHHLRFTAVFEILNPVHQHVVNLSHLPESGRLEFISFVSPYNRNDDVITNDGDDVIKVDSYCAMAPETGFKLCHFVGVPTVSYKVICPDESEGRMDEVRRSYGSEGEVFYFVDKDNKVIGLLKKKTAWYVLCRAIREKVAHSIRQESLKPGSGGNTAGSISARLHDIQKWLGFPDEFREAWIKLGVDFLEWALAKCKTTSSSSNKPETVVPVRTQFPVLWRQFLNDTGKTDQVDWHQSATT